MIKQLWTVSYTGKSRIVKFLHRKIDTLKKKKRKRKWTATATRNFCKSFTKELTKRTCSVVDSHGNSTICVAKRCRSPAKGIDKAVDSVLNASRDEEHAIFLPPFNFLFARSCFFWLLFDFLRFNWTSKLVRCEYIFIWNEDSLDLKNFWNFYGFTDNILSIWMLMLMGRL